MIPRIVVHLSDDGGVSVYADTPTDVRIIDCSEDWAPDLQQHIPYDDAEPTDTGCVLAIPAYDDPDFVARIFALEPNA